MLDGSAYAERDVEFRCDRLAGAADLAIEREPAVVADGARGSNFSAKRLGERLGDGEVFLLLDAASDGDDDLSLAKIDGLLGFLEDFVRRDSRRGLGNRCRNVLNWRSSGF